MNACTGHLFLPTGVKKVRPFAILGEQFLGLAPRYPHGLD